MAALQVLALMIRLGIPLSELAKEAMERVPQVLENVSFSRKVPLEKMSHLGLVEAKIQKALGKEGRTLIRWSGTEPKLRIMLEGPDEKTIQRYAKERLNSSPCSVLYSPSAARCLWALSSASAIDSRPRSFPAR